MDLNKIKEAMDVLEEAQQKLWQLSHKVRKVSDHLGDAVWSESLQIEHGLLVLNEQILGGKSYYEKEEK